MKLNPSDRARFSDPSRMLKSAAVVAAFWWCAVTAWGWVFLQSQHTSLTSVLTSPDINLGTSTQQHLVTLCALVILAWLWMLNSALRRRRALFLSLLPQEKNGLHSSLGSVSNCLYHDQVYTPCIATRAIHTADFLALPCKTQEYTGIIQWIEEINITHPLHAKALLKCLSLLIKNQNVPAYPPITQDITQPKSPTHTRVTLSSPGITLLNHSIRVAMCAKDHVLKYHYKGIEHGGFCVPATDLTFALSPRDPMVALVALCHDIGKLKSHIDSPLSAVTRIKGAHGVEAARQLAKLDCIQELPAQDQRALYFALTFNDNPALCTLNKKAQIDDDRSAALMMLVFEAHEIALTLELNLLNSEHQVRGSVND